MTKAGFFIEDDSDYFLDRIIGNLISKSDKIKTKLLKKPLKKLYKYKITPNIITLVGFLSAMLANIIIYKTRTFFVVFFIIYLLFDFLDGASAKINSCQTRWGNALDDGVDLTIALITLLNVSFYSSNVILGILSTAILFYQEWVYGLLYRIDVKRIPLHGYIFAQYLFLFGAYELGFYINIALCLVGIFLGYYFYFRAKP